MINYLINLINNVYNIITTGYQKILTAGENITIEEVGGQTVISASGGGGGGLRYIDEIDTFDFYNNQTVDATSVISDTNALPDSFNYIASENLSKVIVSLNFKFLSGATLGAYRHITKNIFIDGNLIYPTYGLEKIEFSEISQYMDVYIENGGSGNVDLRIKSKSVADPDYSGTLSVYKRLIY